MTVINSFNFRCEIVLCFFFVFVVHQVQKKNGHKDTMHKIIIFQQHQVIKILKKKKFSDEKNTWFEINYPKGCVCVLHLSRILNELREAIL